MFTLPVTAPVSTFVVPAADPHFAAETALHELAGHVRALRLGLAPFDVLTPEERAEQLAQLVDDEPRPVSDLSNDELIAIISNDSTPFPRMLAATQEVDRRLKVLPLTPANEISVIDDAPDAETRTVIEDADFLEHIERTMAGEAEFTLDAPLHGRGISWAD